MPRFYSVQEGMMTLVVIYTDFDGTITNRSGNNTVFKPFYQSLLHNYKEGVVEQDYKTTPMKEPTQVQALFEEKFGPFTQHFNFSQSDADILMSPEAIVFFHALLLEDRVKINIITKNRDDYIQALFRYQGFSEEEIARLNIMFIGTKYSEVNNNLQSTNTRADLIYLLDDNPDDYRVMYRAIRDNAYDLQQIKGYQLEPGKFQWGQYLADIQAFLRVEKVEEDRSDQQSELQAANHEPLKPKPHSMLQTEIVPEKGISKYRIAGLFAAIGFTLGLALGISLAASGVLTPFGVGILGILALGAIFGVGTACLFSSVGFAIAKGLEPGVISDAEETQQNKSYLVMQREGLNSQAPKIEPTQVAHYPSLIKPEEKSLASVSVPNPFELKLAPN